MSGEKEDRFVLLGRCAKACHDRRADVGWTPHHGDARARERVHLFGSGSFSTGGDVSRFQRSTVPAKATEAMPGMPMAGTATPGVAAPAAVQGPVVRVARGNSVTVVPVGGKN